MSPSAQRWPVAVAVLRLAGRLVEEIRAGVLQAGFTDVTPLHGFAFARIAEADVTVADLAAHLG